MHFLSLCLLFLFLACSQHKHIEVQIKKDIRIACLIGDSGNGLDASGDVITEMNKHQCDIVFIIGDVIYNRGIDGLKDPELFEKLIIPFKDTIIDTPIFILLGNHDYKGNTKAWLNIKQVNQNLNFPHYYYIVRDRSNCFIAMDTNANYLEQLDWKSDIENLKCKNKIYLAHHPIISSGQHGDAYFINRYFINSMIPKNSLYIAGHEHHLSDEGSFGEGRIQLISGAGSKLRELAEKPQKWGESTKGFLKLVLSEDRVDYLFIGMVNKEFKTLYQSSFLNK
tara:strand:+ start:4812 stop:5654 length:843 start_codon:yes stop_codon:yes gene_type:complete